ncbi:MAG: hypothetical protein K2P16_08175, partial [Lawsonibacter sp.]|nr:hypothetical protein [Lawsonibacter sp.]
LAAGYDDCLHSIQLLYYGLALPGGVSPLANLLNAALVFYQQDRLLSRAGTEKFYGISPPVKKKLKFPLPILIFLFLRL